MFDFFIYKQLFELFKTKALYLFQIIAAFLLPIKVIMLLVGFMILVDTLSGIWKAWKTNEKITSRKLSNIISKMVLYQTGIITIFVLDKFLLGEFVASFTSIPLFLVKITAIFFATVELVSINENIKLVTGMNMFQTFKNMLLRVKGVKDNLTDIGKKD